MAQKINVDVIRLNGAPDGYVLRVGDDELTWEEAVVSGTVDSAEVIELLKEYLSGFDRNIVPNISNTNVIENINNLYINSGSIFIGTNEIRESDGSIITENNDGTKISLDQVDTQAILTYIDSDYITAIAPPTGAQGPQGVTGIQGGQGVQGGNGTGIRGAQGIQGICGAQGAIGNDGTQGLIGCDPGIGEQGPRGVQGITGDQGLQGITGDQGLQGKAGVGIRGAQGLQGIQGIRGAAGESEVDGEQGLQGFQGVQGVQGAQGAQGCTGIQGIQGAQGAQGIQGFFIPADDGAQGSTGLQGINGIRGFQGEDGFRDVYYLNDLNDVEAIGNTLNIGTGSGFGYTDTDRDKISIGYYAGSCNTGLNNINIGRFAGGSVSLTPKQTSEGISIGENANGASNNGNQCRIIAIGNHAGFDTEASHAVMIGTDVQRCEVNTPGVAIGFRARCRGSSYSQPINIACKHLTSSTAIGAFAGYCGDFGEFSPGSIAIGYSAAGQTQNISNHLIAIGAQALELSDAPAGAISQIGSPITSMPTGEESAIIIGYRAGQRAKCVGDGSYTGAAIIIGHGALICWNGSGGHNNIAIGRNAGCTPGALTGVNNILLGRNSQPSLDNASGEIVLGDTSIGYIKSNTQTITSLSDCRDKCDIQDIPYGLNFISSLRPVCFDWNRRKGEFERKKDIGFIAQELQEVEQCFDLKDFTKLTMKLGDSDETLEASPINTYPILIKALIELDAQLEELEEEIDFYRGRQ